MTHFYQKFSYTSLNNLGLHKKIKSKLHQTSLYKIALSFISHTVQHDSIACRKVTYDSLWHVIVMFWAWYLHEISEKKISSILEKKMMVWFVLCYVCWTNIRSAENQIDKLKLTLQEQQLSDFLYTNTKEMIYLQLLPQTLVYRPFLTAFKTDRISC